MNLRTASEGIRYATDFEGKIAEFYRELISRWPERASPLGTFEKAARGNATTIERTYYGAITDAVEGGFCFDLDTQEFDITPTFPMHSVWADAMAEAIHIEHRALRFYEQAASQSAGLLSDVSRVFRRIATRRQDAIAMLGTMRIEQEE